MKVNNKIKMSLIVCFFSLLIDFTLFPAFAQSSSSSRENKPVCLVDFNGMAAVSAKIKQRIDILLWKMGRKNPSEHYDYVEVKVNESWPSALASCFAGNYKEVIILGHSIKNIAGSYVLAVPASLENLDIDPEGNLVQEIQWNILNGVVFDKRIANEISPSIGQISFVGCKLEDFIKNYPGLAQLIENHNLTVRQAPESSIALITGVEGGRSPLGAINFVAESAQNPDDPYLYCYYSPASEQVESPCLQGQFTLSYLGTYKKLQEDTWVVMDKRTKKVYTLDSPFQQWEYGSENLPLDSLSWEQETYPISTSFWSLEKNVPEPESEPESESRPLIDSSPSLVKWKLADVQSQSFLLQQKFKDKLKYLKLPDRGIPLNIVNHYFDTVSSKEFHAENVLISERRQYENTREIKVDQLSLPSSIFSARHEIVIKNLRMSRLGESDFSYSLNMSIIQRDDARKKMHIKSSGTFTYSPADGVILPCFPSEKDSGSEDDDVNEKEDEKEDEEEARLQSIATSFCFQSEIKGSLYKEISFYPSNPFELLSFVGYLKKFPEQIYYYQSKSLRPRLEKLITLYRFQGRMMSYLTNALFFSIPWTLEN